MSLTAGLVVDLSGPTTAQRHFTAVPSKRKLIFHIASHKYVSGMPCTTMAGYPWPSSLCLAAVSFGYLCRESPRSERSTAQFPKSVGSFPRPRLSPRKPGGASAARTDESAQPEANWWEGAAREISPRRNLPSIRPGVVVWLKLEAEAKILKGCSAWSGSIVVVVVSSRARRLFVV